jgi:hypothetical protein
MRSGAINFVHSVAGNNPVKLWHRRLGYLDVRNVYILQSMVKGMDINKIPCPTSTLVYDAYTEDKQYATKWSNNGDMLATKPLKIVHFSYL